MDQQIAALKELIEQRFDNSDMRLDGVIAQTTKTNGRLQTAEKDIAILKDRLYVSAGAILVVAIGYVVRLFL